MGLDRVGAGTRAVGVHLQVDFLPILPFVLDGGHLFRIFVAGDGLVVDAGRPGMFNPFDDSIMVKAKLGKHEVEIYDTIEELPMVRFHKYQKLLLIDAGIGSDITAFDQRGEKIRRYILAGDKDKALAELANFRQAVYFVQNGINPKHRAFALLVASIDGEPTEATDAGIDAVLDKLGDTPVSQLAARMDAVKKKIDGELIQYFPALFEDSEIKAYFDLMRKRTLAVLANIAAGEGNPDGTAEVDKMTAALITYSNPKVFSGPEGLEVQYDRQFEDLCLSLSEQLHTNPKGMSVLEFYNAFDFVQRRAKAAKKGQK